MHTTPFRFIHGLLLVFMALVLSGCPQKVIVNYYGAPSLVPGTRPEMNTAGFWIGRHADPDLIVMTGDEVQAFNASVKEKTKAVHDVTLFSPTRSGTALRGSLKNMLAYVASRNYVDGKGAPATDTLISVEGIMGIDAIPATVNVHWAYIVKPCDQRILPTAEPLYRNATDTAIDRLQNNAMDMATPVVVLHESVDHEWFYVMSPYSDGWVKAESVALCPLEQMERFEAWTPFVISTAAKVDLFADPLLRRHIATIQMGTKLPLLGEADGGTLEVLVPARSEGGWCVFDAAYVSVSQVHKGFLPYTPRNAITQAFRLLNTPYGWGGMYGEQDCSRFVQEIFACFGISLPRNSTQQGKAGRLVAAFDRTFDRERRREILLAEARGGITTLQLPGHIMLYLGDADGVPYAIHDLHAYTEPVEGEERLVSINRVAVTGLTLGEGTKKGSLLMRLVNVREISPGKPEE